VKPSDPRYKKARARWATRYAIKTGRLVPGPCEMAGLECHGKIEAHHDDYRKPLDVRWFCRRHHLKIDGHAMARPFNKNGMGKRRTA